MDLQQLKHFQAAARAGSLTRAARELYISQPGLSKSLSRLEEELGVPLFDRRKGKIELNEYGRLFLSSVDAAFAQLEDGRQTVQRMYENDGQILSIASNIHGYLADHLPAFCKAHPEIGIRELDCDTLQMTEKLLDRSVTLGITCQEIHHDQLRYREIDNQSFVLAVHADDPLAARDSVHISGLKDSVFICDRSRLCIGPLQKFCREEGFTLKIDYEIDNNDLIFNLVEQQLGIAILPLGLSCMLLHAHPGHHVRLIRLCEELPRIVLGIAVHGNYRFTPQAELFEEFLHSRISEERELIHRMGYGHLL